jgi:hypothetical protein
LLSLASLFSTSISIDYGYCKQDGCDWRTGTLRNARIHLQRQHNIISFEEPSKSAKVLNRTLEKVFARQGLMDPASY